MKKCVRCGIEKEEKDFRKDYNICRQCNNLQQKKYYEEHKEQRRIYSQEYYSKEENKERSRKNRQIWIKNNKEKIREYTKNPVVKARKKLYDKKYFQKPEVKERLKKKYKENIAYRIRNLIGNRIRKVLKQKDFSKQYKSCLDYLPYTMEELKVHLESQFQPGMTWENYGKYGWHIDHIKPMNTFNIISMECEDFKKCWALSNLRPLWAKDNWSRPKDGSDLHENS